MRNRIIQLTMAAFLTLPVAAFAVQLPATGQTGCFDGNGNARACLGSGEDGEKQAGVAWPVPRFSDNGNTTITDALTGLVWSKQANAPDAAPGCANAGSSMSWQQALAYVACLNANSFAGSTDWRLPNLNEMESMLMAGVARSSDYLSARGFTRVQAGLYWTSTNDNSDRNAVPPSELNAWDVDLGTGEPVLSSAKTALRAVWPVRGTSSAPAQLWQTGDSKCYDTAGVRTNPCTPAGQDGDTLAGAAAPLLRFQSNTAGTLTVDNLTGLVWSSESNTPGPAVCAGSGHPMTWQEALDHVKCLNANAYLGVTDWRLPNRKELRSLADYSAGNPALPDINPFSSEQAKGNTFWSSTTNAADPRRAWAVSIMDGSVSGADKRSGLLLAWPVSGPDKIAPALAVNAVTTPTRSATQTISGTVEAGTIPVVTVNSGAAVGAVTVTGTNWSCVISALKVGANVITISAMDFAGNAAAPLTSTITVLNPNGSFSGAQQPVIGDVIKAVRIAVGIIPATADDLLYGDVVPPSQPDGRIDITDALWILRKVVGL